MMEHAWTVSSNMIEEEIGGNTRETDSTLNNDFDGFAKSDPLTPAIEKRLDKLKSLRKHAISNRKLASSFRKGKQNFLKNLCRNEEDEDVHMATALSLSDGEVENATRPQSPVTSSIRTRSKGPVNDCPYVQDAPIEYKK